MLGDLMMNKNFTLVESSVSSDGLVTSKAPQWMVDFVDFRKRLFLRTVEPVIVTLLGPVVEEAEHSYGTSSFEHFSNNTNFDNIESRRRLGFLPNYVEDVSAFKETSMSFATLFFLFCILSCVFMIFLSCFYHNQKTSPLFSSPRRHRLPKLVPPPLPVDGYFSWVKVCFLLSDEEIINRIGYDSLIFLRFHRLALRCIVKMSVFSFAFLLPLNFTGGGHANAEDLKGYVGSLFFTDFLRFTMANVSGGSPKLWVHCFAAYLLTGIVVRELLVEYETFNSIRHRYLLSREPHLRSVLVTNIPRHLRSRAKITSYFKHVYPQSVKAVFMCQNLIHLENLVAQRTSVLAKIEKELLILCRTEKYKLFHERKLKSRKGRRDVNLPSIRLLSVMLREKLVDLGVIDGTQERLTHLYTKLELLNTEVEREQRRRKRVMKMMDKMEAGEGSKDIDYILASPFVSDSTDPKQRRILGLPENNDNNHQNTYPQHQQANYQPPSLEVDTNTAMEHQLPQRTKNNQLRARSPTFNDPSNNQHDDDNDKVHGTKKPVVKARLAIKRYSRFAQDVSFLGRPIHSPVENNGNGHEFHIEDHINEVSDKAFVVMKTFTAATIAIQSMHSSKPGSMHVSTAPEPRDVIWQNIYVSKGATRTRSYLGEIFVMLIITFYVVPIALVSLLVSESALVSSSPRLEQLDQASAFFSSAIAMVQPLCIVCIQQLLPPLFIFIGKSEGLVSFSDVQMKAFSRYFLFQVLNVFLVTTIAGSIFDTIAIIVETPEAAFEMLGNSLPRMSSFFITLVTMKTFLGLGVELVRTMSLVQASLRFLFVPNATLRTLRTVIIGMRAIDDPGWFPFHKILAQDMLVVVISVVFAVVAPLVLLPCSLFCLFSRIMWTHHHLFVYESVFESGGQFWPKIFRRFVFGLIIAQMTITGQFILKEARHEAYATVALMFMTYFFLRSTRARYDPTSSTLPLEVATVMDISLSQEEECRKRAFSQHAQSGGRSEEHQNYNTSGSNNNSDDKQTQTTSSIPDAGGVGMDPNLGAKIGPYDPFEKAYIQPALRANPRARPEQPFPPAQLGREEMFVMDDGNYDSNNSNSSRSSNQQSDHDVLDCGARVRLKSLNQNHRRLINRWWSDQLQRCGKQNMLKILIGEECGTLTIGPRNGDYLDLNNGETPAAASHEFV